MKLIRPRLLRYFVYFLVTGLVLLTIERLWNKDDHKKTHTLHRNVTKFLQRESNTMADTIKQARDFTLQNCIPVIDDKQIHDSENTSLPVTPFKIFVYDLAPKYNHDILKCLIRRDPCFQLSHCGMGPELYEEGLLSIRDTHQFSLEVIIHHQMLFSPYRTLDPEKADIFYIPAYLGLACFCHSQSESHRVHVLIQDLFNYLKSRKYYPIGTNNGKIHVSSLAKIEREQASTHCPLLKYRESQKILFLAIEQEVNIGVSRWFNIGDQPLIVVPYPSYGHISQNSQHASYTRDIVGNYTMAIPLLNQRHIFLFLAAGSRRSNEFRAKLMDQFVIKTRSSYKEFYSSGNNILGHKTPGHNRSSIDQVMLYTDECRGHHKYTTITWMRHSIFCLQPPGDSPTRKSFYDSIVSGCIPVIFIGKDPVTYPFANILQYSEFTVKIPISPHINIYDSLKNITAEKIAALHLGVRRVSHLLQYNVPTGNIQPHTDAMKLIMTELEHYFKQDVR